jgi:hypothetical protein
MLLSQLWQQPQNSSTPPAPQALRQAVETREAAIAAREAAADARVSEALAAVAAAQQVAQRSAAADLAQERQLLEAECARLEAEQRRVADMKQVGGMGWGALWGALVRVLRKRMCCAAPCTLNEASKNAAAAQRAALELAGHAAREERLRRAEAARCEAEARAAGLAAGEQVLQSQLDAALADAAALRRELGKRSAISSQAAEALLRDAAGWDSHCWCSCGGGLLCRCSRM